MRVILKQDIKGVGKKDQIINAADGYARNYLFPKNLAVPADVGNMNNLKSKNESMAFKKWCKIHYRLVLDWFNDILKEQRDLLIAEKKITVKIPVKAGDNGKLFGGVTAKEIAETLKKDFNIDVDKKKVLLSETIKVAGCSKVDIKLNEGVMASVQVMVVPK